jgi:hypothetical protein
MPVSSNVTIISSIVADGIRASIRQSTINKGQVAVLVLNISEEFKARGMKATASLFVEKVIESEEHKALVDPLRPNAPQ